MPSQIDLVWLGGRPAPAWLPGRVYRSGYSPDDVAAVIARHGEQSRARAWLFWDSALPMPAPDCLESALQRSADVWHAGLSLGLAGMPHAMDYVQPTWFFNSDPDPDVEATSWRLSLRACLMRRDVLLKMGPLASGFETLEGASLELGHRYIARGVLVRHLPGLTDSRTQHAPARLPRRDGWRFLYHRFGAFWTLWAATRAALTGELGAADCIDLAGILRGRGRKCDPAPYRDRIAGIPPRRDARVAAIVPTIDRYPYLKKLLRQLCEQSIRPAETIVVDQTPAGRREPLDDREFGGIGLRVLYLDEAGQCTSRNTALAAAEGDYLLLLDDDVEIPRDLVERHLAAAAGLGADVSCGVCREVGAGPLPEAFLYVRASDVFPAGNTLLSRRALARSGLFDLAYNRGQRADCDLGIRLCRTGALAVLNPAASVLHHHAPKGGLRVHKARVTTYADSRNRVLKRVVPSASEIYLAKRYFAPGQVREMLWLAAAGTLKARGNAVKAAAKMLFGLLALPATVMEIRANARAASALLETCPCIPELRVEHAAARVACE